MRVAVEGCGHGMLNTIYASIEAASKAAGWDGVDLLIIGGDFQVRNGDRATRNTADLGCMAVPPKYREMGDFHEYYSGKRTAPYLTIFVGGNHEASNHSLELFYGGWVAPNIYYMGAAGVLRCGDLRIAGLSGIWKGYDYGKPHFEQPPFNSDEIKSVYHLREYDVKRLLCIRTQVDIGISHDWPNGMEWMGDFQTLFKIKPFFEEEARTNTLGSPVTRELLNHLRPLYWFSAHLHCKYAAMINHDGPGSTLIGHQSHDASEPTSLGDGPGEWQTATPLITAKKNPEEIEIDSDASSVASNQKLEPPEDSQEKDSLPYVAQDDHNQLPISLNAATTLPSRNSTLMPISNRSTRFLALDKCLSGRQFLQLLEVEPVHQSEEVAKSPCELEYDREWLALNRVFSNDLGLGPTKRVVESELDAAYMTLFSEAEAWVEENLVRKGNMTVPKNFEMTAPIFDSSQAVKGNPYPKDYMNPQTAAFCEMLQIPNPYPFDPSEGKGLDHESRNGNPGRQGPRSYRSRGGDNWRSRRGGRGRRVY